MRPAAAALIALAPSLAAQEHQHDHDAAQLGLSVHTVQDQDAPQSERAGSSRSCTAESFAAFAGGCSTLT